MKEIKNITAKNFKKYGTVIELTPDSKDGWEILVKVPEGGWRIACLEFYRKSTNMLEHHPLSKESFEPLSGIALLLVAENGSPDDFEVFLLDIPVCLNEKIWHQVVSLSQLTRVKITENYEVECVYHQLKNEVVPGVEFMDKFP